MSQDSDLMAKAGQIRDLFEIKWVEQEMEKFEYGDMKENAPGSKSMNEARYREQIDGVFDWVLPQFEWFTGMSKDDCQTMKGIVDSIRDGLGNTNAAETSKLATVMLYWKGDAADEFEERFLTHFETAVRNQEKIAMELGLAIQQVSDHIDRTHEAINRVADETLRQLNALGVVDSGTFVNIIKVGFAIVSAVVALAATAGSGGALAPVLVTSGIAVATSLMFEYKINGGTVEAVQDSLVNAIGNLKMTMDSAEDGLIKALNSNNRVIDETLTSEENRRYLYPTAPTMEDGLKAGEMTPLNLRSRGGKSRWQGTWPWVPAIPRSVPPPLPTAGVCRGCGSPTPG